MVPPDSAHNDARMAFLKYFKWKRIATIQQNDYVFDEVTCLSRYPVVLSPFYAIHFTCFITRNYKSVNLRILTLKLFASIGLAAGGALVTILLI